ncbi:MAG: hypothetical protein AAFR98_07180 [Pseudomonadota bacterium]
MRDYKFMIINNKYFVEPPNDGSTIKRLFQKMVAEGAGRPVDANGIVVGPWTAALLTEAISEIDVSRRGVELRAVQLWLQDNDKGIGQDNIRWLARIFGCGDPDRTVAWQSELVAAQARLVASRRDKRRSRLKGNEHSLDLDELDQLRTDSSSSVIGAVANGASNRLLPPSSTFAERCERMLSGAAALNLQFGYWLLFCGLGLMNYVLGTLSVTYNPREGLDKQVGFIWAPTLTILPLIALPAYIFFVSNMNTYWRRVGRLRCVSDRVTSVNAKSDAAWYAKVNEFRASFWAITLFCLLFVFGFQWAGIYLPAYLSGDTNGVQIDRYLVALVRPEVITIPEAIFLSAVGYMYTASYISIFMFGLLFSIIVTLDYVDICTTSELEGTTIDRKQLRKEGEKIAWAVFRVSVFALWLATLVKLQITYLQSDSTDFVTWLRIDAATVFGANVPPNGWLDNSSISHFTTFMMMVVTMTIFIVCVMKISSIFDRLALYDSDYPFTRNKRAIATMFLVIMLLLVNLVSVGRMSGFSLILAASALATVYVLAGPRLRTL